MVLQGIADKVYAHIEYNFGRMSRQPSSVENNKISAKPIQLIYILTTPETAWYRNFGGVCIYL